MSKVVNPGNARELVAETMQQLDLIEDNGRKCLRTKEELLQVLAQLADWCAANQPNEEMASALFEAVMAYHPPGPRPAIEMRRGAVDPESGAIQGLESFGVTSLADLPGSPGVDNVLPPKFRKRPTSLH